MTAEVPVRVVVADPQPIFRAGVRHILSAFPDIAVVGETGSSLDALALCERLRPAVLLIDPLIPGGNTVILRLHERRLPTRALILAERVDPTLLAQGLQLGIGGYLLKQIDAFDFAHAVRSAASGLLTLSPEVSAAAFTPDDGDSPDPDGLSEREQVVLELLLDGLSNRAIAARLHLSCATVKFHLGNIYTKLGVRTRSEAIALLYRQRHEPTAPQLGRGLATLWSPRLAVVG